LGYNKAIQVMGFRSFVNDAKSLQKLKKKYRVLAKKYHPDTGGSEDKFKELGAAHAFLLSHMVQTKTSQLAAKSTFSDFCEYLEKHDMTPLRKLFTALGGDESTLIKWLNMAVDLSYVTNVNGTVSVLYIPPGLTIGRLYFAHAVRMATGFKGNEEYKAAESRYRQTLDTKR
jgi:hypothetical protein